MGIEYKYAAKKCDDDACTRCLHKCPLFFVRTTAVLSVLLKLLLPTCITAYGIAGLLSLALVCNLLVRPIDPKYHVVEKPTVIDIEATDVEYVVRKTKADS